MVEHVIKVGDAVVIEFSNGMRLRLEAPAAGNMATAPAALAKGRPGRKPSPATQTLIAALQQDAAHGEPRTRQAYLAILTEAGHEGSPNSAYMILNREAKRIFGKPLGRSRAAKSRRKAGGRGPQRRHEAELLRERMAKDKADGGLREPSHYLRWLMDQKGISVGMKGARPIIYRVLREAKAGQAPAGTVM